MYNLKLNYNKGAKCYHSHIGIEIHCKYAFYVTTKKLISIILMKCHTKFDLNKLDKPDLNAYVNQIIKMCAAVCWKLKMCLMKLVH